MRCRGSRFSLVCFFLGHRFPGGPIESDDFHEMAHALAIPCERCGNDRLSTGFSPDTLGHWWWIARRDLAWRWRETRSAIRCGFRPAPPASEPDDLPF